MKYTAIVAAMIMAGALLSGRVDINFHHNLQLPKEISQPNTIKYSYDIFTLSKRVDIYVRDTLEKHSQVKDMIQILNEADSRTTVYFHLAGYGGSVETYELLINTIKASKAYIVMLVEAPVYSGHAYLALNGNKLVVYPYSYLMFHASSALNVDCSTRTGTDRGVSNVEHCKDMLNAHISLANSMVYNMPILTAAEKEWILTGHDVYIMSNDPRLNK